MAVGFRLCAGSMRPAIDGRHFALGALVALDRTTAGGGHEKARGGSAAGRA